MFHNRGIYVYVKSFIKYFIFQMEIGPVDGSSLKPLNRISHYFLIFLYILSAVYDLVIFCHHCSGLWYIALFFFLNTYVLYTRVNKENMWLIRISRRLHFGFNILFPINALDLSAALFLSMCNIFIVYFVYLSQCV